ncbi:MAG: alpha/beta fold hydrolase [Pseudomonadota bacterium]
MAATKYAGILQFQADLAWAGWEYASGFVSEPLLHMLAPKAHAKRPVMTLPGFTGSERTLNSLNRFLNNKGYIAGPWGLGTNWGHSSVKAMRVMVDSLVQRVETLATRHNSPVSLVGHSLGGLYARELARKRPDLIDRVITLGTPANAHPEHPERLNQSVNAMFDTVTGRPGHEHTSEMRNAGVATPPPGVPVVSVYSPFDGVVSEAASRIPDHLLTDDSGAARENLKITGSHTGMVVNPLALLAIADRLKADPANWEPYKNPLFSAEWRNSAFARARSSSHSPGSRSRAS